MHLGRFRTPARNLSGLETARVPANYGLRLGKFERDFADGEVRFQVSQILVDDAVGQDVTDRMIGTTVNMLDTYLPALLSVIYANELPKEAIARAEAGWAG